MNAIARTGRAIEALHRFWSGRRVVVVSPGAGRLADQLTDCGATVCGVTDDTSLRDPAPELAAWLDEVDPDRSALVLGTQFTDVPEVCGRLVHGWRRAECAAWEDKTRIDQLWRDIGVSAPAHVVLAADDPAVHSVMTELDKGRGVVVAMDSTREFRGDAKGLRWVRRRAELDAALAAFHGLTDRLRVAEFVDGVPCSVLGLVLDGGVAVFDPIEIITLRDPNTGRLLFCGSSTHWRPETEAADTIRHCARLAGQRLAELIGYRGLFSVDGVLGEDFLATELNPRHASGLGISVAWPEFPIYLLHRAAQESVPGVVDLPWRDVEDAFRQLVRRQPSCSITVPSGQTGLVDGEHTMPGLRYRLDASTARVLNIQPDRADGAVGPMIATLAGKLGSPCTTSFAEPVSRSTLRTMS